MVRPWHLLVFKTVDGKKYALSEAIREPKSVENLRKGVKLNRKQRGARKVSIPEARIMGIFDVKIVRPWSEGELVGICQLTSRKQKSSRISSNNDT